MAKLNNAHSGIYHQFGYDELDSEDITSSSEGVAASTTKEVTGITTNGDEDADSVTLADAGDESWIKFFILKTKGHANDSVVITPADFKGYSTITFDTEGQGCILIRHYGKWCCVGNNGGTLA